MITAESPPYCKGHWLMGCLPEFRRDLLGFYTHCARTYGDIVAFRVGHRPVVLVSHPDLIEQVLVNDNRNYSKHYAWELIRPLLGNGLVMSEGDFWLRQRRLMQPAFHRRQLQLYSLVITELTEQLISGWHSGDLLDLQVEMMQLTMQTAGKTLLNVDITQESGDIEQSVQLLMQDFHYRFVSAFPIPLWIPTPWNRRVLQAVDCVESIIYRIIEERKTTTEEHNDLLSVLLKVRDEDGSQMTDTQLRDEVMTLFLAGYETTALTLMWTWYLLSMYPSVEQKLLEELKAVVGDRLPTYEDLPDLVYTEQVVKESMRLYPPAYAIGRMAINDCELGGYQIRKGTNIFISQWVVHRDERFFEDPESFRPERWEHDLEKQLPKYAYFPFGGGPRICIGNTFAMMEAILVVAVIAQQFHFQLVNGHEVVPWPSVTLRPKNGVKVLVQRRQQKTGTRKAS